MMVRKEECVVVHVHQDKRMKMMMRKEECVLVHVHQDKRMKIMMMKEECGVVHVHQEMMTTMMMKAADGMAILKVIQKHHAVDGNSGSLAADVRQTGEAAMMAEVADAAVAKEVRVHLEATVIAADGMVIQEDMPRQHKKDGA